MMRKVLVVLATSLLLSLTVLASGASAARHNSSQLEEAGWLCMNVGPSNLTYCFPPGRDPVAEPGILPAKVFSDDGSLYLGSAKLIHEDFHWQSIELLPPCPQSGTGTYEYLGDFGLPYFVCHRFEYSHPTGFLDFQVQDDETGLPISDATVCLFEDSGMTMLIDCQLTDATGFAHFENILSGFYTTTATAVGYEVEVATEFEYNVAVDLADGVSMDIGSANADVIQALDPL